MGSKAGDETRKWNFTKTKNSKNKTGNTCLHDKTLISETECEHLSSFTQHDVERCLL